MPGEPTPDQTGSIDVSMSQFGVEAVFLNQNFIANTIAPVVPVTSMTGKYSVYVPVEGLNIQHEEPIGHGGVATEMNFLVSEGMYSCQQFGKKHLVTDREEANQDLSDADYLKGDSLILQNLATSREYSLASMGLTQANHFAASHWIAAVAAWDAADANPKDDIDNAVRIIGLDSGFVPNVMVVPPRTYDVLTSNDDVKDLIRYMGGIPYLQTGRIPGDLIYNLKILKAGAIYDQNAPLQATNLGFLWENASIAAGDDWAMILYVDPNPSRKSGGAFATFAFDMERISDMDIVTFRVYRDDLRWGEWREARTDYVSIFTNNRAAAVITGLRTDTSS